MGPVAATFDTDRKGREGASMFRGRRLRKLTVTTRGSWPHYRQVPQVRMSGDWLGHAGFKPGTFLDVAVSEGMLVITVAAVNAIQPDPEIIRKAVVDLQREYARRFPKRQRKN
jgi:Toxin SymE, type I toxin-antitoxin system